jgi:cytidylate kinase
VAAALGFAFLDTGAMYRAATWWAVHRHIDLEDPVALAENTRQMQLSLEETPTGQRVLANGVDITAEIRSPEITRLIYRLDQIPAVRAQLVELQREFGARQPTVAEGRDMGTVVFPQAGCKIYLDASLDERTRRRARDLREKGYEVDEAALRAEIFERDEQGMKRETSPLRPAEDAIRLDTSDLSQDEVVERIVQLARERL